MTINLISALLQEKEKKECLKNKDIPFRAYSVLHTFNKEVGLRSLQTIIIWPQTPQLS
jgi:hypothetical protein